MYPYWPTLLGISISVILFLFTYRQAIGAARERARSANFDIENTLLKRIVLDRILPTPSDIARLVDAKAREHRVRVTDLYSPTQLLNGVYSRLMENDFITPSQREEILNRMNPVLEAIEEATVREVPGDGLDMSWRTSTMAVVILGVLASLAGSTFAVAVTGEEAKNVVEALNEYRTPFLISLLLVGTIAAVLQFMQWRLEPTAGRVAQAAAEFEREVEGVLKKLGVLKQTGGGPYDFLVERGGKKIIIEAKAWEGPLSPSLLTRVVRLLEHVLDIESADEAVLVTKAPVHSPADLLREGRVKIMSISQLRNYLAQKQH